MNDDRRKNSAIGGIKIQTVGIALIIISVIFAVTIVNSILNINTLFRNYADTTQTRSELQANILSFEDASAYLTNNVRAFVSTGRRIYLDNYFREVYETKRREHAMAEIQATNDSESIESLKAASERSTNLEVTEKYAMCLYIDALGMDRETFHKDLVDILLAPADEALTPAQKKNLAEEMVYTATYEDVRENITREVNKCVMSVSQKTIQFQKESADRLQRLIRWQTIIIVFEILFLCGMLVFGYYYILRPMRIFVRNLKDDKTLPLEGAYELQYISDTYNNIYEENQYIRDQLSFEATHDSLTGLYNRREFEARRLQGLYKTLVLIDVDRFKTYNDKYGHDVGDRVLMRVAHVLSDSFRKSDIICRIGGDEFAVLMRSVTMDKKDMLENRLKSIQEKLSHEEDGLPSVTLSIGVAFEDRKTETQDAFKDADQAMYEVKQQGRNGYSFFNMSAQHAS